MNSHSGVNFDITPGGCYTGIGVKLKFTGGCAENCPAQAISRDSLKTADSKKCISCMRCVAGCPRSARKVNGALVSVAAMAIKKACSERKEAELFY